MLHLTFVLEPDATQIWDKAERFLPTWWELLLICAKFMRPITDRGAWWDAASPHPRGFNESRPFGNSSGSAIFTSGVDTGPCSPALVLLSRPSGQNITAGTKHIVITGYKSQQGLDIK
jgi:hypothetical protein